MSSTTWTQAALASELRPWQGALWRAVEAQHRVATARLVDTLQEQALLEDLLESSSHPVDAVAGLCGFGSPAILRHHFRQQLATTPKAYRAMFGARADA